jgi:hypothetical protein
MAELGRSWWSVAPIDFAQERHMDNRSRRGRNDWHQRAAEFHDLAAHAHRVAATHHGQEDHQTGRELSKQAMEYSAKAHQYSRDAYQKPGNSFSETRNPARTESVIRDNGVRKRSKKKG